MKKILLIDGHSILNRAFYGLPDLTNYEGLHTNAVLGFLNIIFKIMDEEKPDHMCVAFDVHEPTFRHLKYSAYKGTRKPMPEELREQVPLMKEVLTAMHVTIVQKGGYEADDIIGTISRMAERNGYATVIVSGDRDLLQLATDTILVRIPKTKASGTTIENYYAKDVVEAYGVTPVQFIDMKGLMGDTSDNIPGVPGIGEKTAAKLMIEYGSMENILDHLDTVKPPRVQKNLTENMDLAVMSKDLATIKLDCELDISLDEMTIESLFNDDSYKIFKRLGFNSLLKKFGTVTETAEINPVITLLETTEQIDGFLADKMKNIDKIGLYPIWKDGTLFGLSAATSDKEVYILSNLNGMEHDRLTENIVSATRNGMQIDILDLKEALSVFPFDESDTKVHDIGVAAYLLNPMEDVYSYDAVARDYLGATLPSEKELVGKDELNLFSFANETFQKLFAYKALIPYLVGDLLMEHLKKQEMFTLYNEIEMPTVYTLYDMEHRGIRVDRKALDDYSVKLQSRIDELHTDIIGYAGKEFNINSPKQLGVILFEDMGLSGGKKTKTGYSTSVDVLEKIKNDHPIIPAILEYRQLTKLNSTYAQGLTAYISEDGRIHGTFNQTITATGRISSTDPNLQNIPMKLELGRLIRKAFIPEDGYVFVDADYSQIELRVLAHLSGDQVMQNAFLNHVDIHATTASEVFDVPIDQVTSLQRRNAKAVNFGIVYGISAFGLSEDLGISRKEAADYIEKYFATYKNIKSFLDRQVEEAKADGVVRTMFGRIRPVPELRSSNFMTRSFGERVAMNSPIQGTAADIIKIAMFRVNMELKKRGLKSRLILQIHDELLVETAKDEIDIVKEIMEKEMMGAANMAVPLEIGISEGDNWYDAK